MPMVQFLRSVLLELLVEQDKDTIRMTFLRIAGAEKLRLLREGLQLFLHHFVLRNMKNLSGELQKVLTEKIVIVEEVLSRGDSKLLL